MSLVVRVNNHKIPVYLRGNMMIWREMAVNRPNFFQYVAPMVFGMISETTRIRKVMMAETIPTMLTPKMSIL